MPADRFAPTSIESEDLDEYHQYMQEGPLAVGLELPAAKAYLSEQIHRAGHDADHSAQGESNAPDLLATPCDAIEDIPSVD